MSECVTAPYSPALPACRAAPLGLPALSPRCLACSAQHKPAGPVRPLKTATVESQNWALRARGGFTHGRGCGGVLVT